MPCSLVVSSLKVTQFALGTRSWLTLNRRPAHDFFNEQPIKNASVFLLKAILHDWSVFVTQLPTVRVE